MAERCWRNGTSCYFGPAAFIDDRSEGFGSHQCDPHFPSVAPGRSEVGRYIVGNTRYGIRG